MMRTYTQSIREGFYDIVEQDMTQFWTDLGDRAALIDNGKWKEHFQSVISKYKLSSRFALMRILFEKVTQLSLSEISEEALAEGFFVDGIGYFEDVTISHAEAMDDQELNRYKQLLLQRVEDHNPGYIPEAERLISRALKIAADGAKSGLNREELLHLGHLVDFTLEDMQFILLRVLGDNEASFNFSSSTDIIHMYGFVAGSSLDEIKNLLKWYKKNCGNIKKIEDDDKPTYCTRDIAESIENKFDHMRIDEFKDWLKNQAPVLDKKRKSARIVYMNLAAYIYDKFRLIDDKNADDLRGGYGFYNDMEMVASFRAYSNTAKDIFGIRSNRPDKEKCEIVADAIAFENAEYATDFGGTQEDKDDLKVFHMAGVDMGKRPEDAYKDGFKGQTVDEKWFHVLSLTKKGDLKLDRCKQRMMEILLDKEAPTKSDLLYLVWITSLYFWSGDMMDAKEKKNIMDDFLSASSCLLQAALLPDVYPPNVLEEAMLFGYALQDEDHNAAMVYEMICDRLVKRTGAGMPAGARRMKREQKLEVVRWCEEHEAEYSSKKECMEACAEKYHIGFSSVEGYIRKFRNGAL